MTSLHQLGTAFSAPFLQPESRTYWVGLLVFLVIAVCHPWLTQTKQPKNRQLKHALRHPSSQLDLQLFFGRQLLQSLGAVPIFVTAWWIATRSVRWLDHTIGPQEGLEWSQTQIAITYSLTLFVVWDLSRFVVHWMMHRVPALWAIHKVHHSAEVLTPMTFHRIHPIESWIYSLRGAVATGSVAGLFYYLFRDQVSHYSLLGVPAIGFLLNIATGNLRHSHVWISFPTPVEKWFLSPAQHQVHHSAETIHHGSNYGSWLAIWDRAIGSWQPALRAPVAYGLAPHEKNHDHHLLSAWFGPLRGLVPGATAAFAVCLGLFSGHTHAQDESDDPESSEEENESESNELDNRYGEEMFVYEDGRTPRVAGSAHKVAEGDLERFESNNIEQIIAQIPGTSTRSEDGFGLRPNIGIRGANSDRSAKITLMEDGVLLAPAPYAAPAAYYFPMSTRLVGVEVFKGPASTRHGPYTVGGALNVLTRDIPEENQHYGDVSGGLWGTRKAHVYSGLLGDSTGLLLEGVSLQSDGFKTLESGDPTGFSRNELMAKGEWLLTADQRLELKLGFSNEQSNETYLGLSQSDFDEDPYQRYPASALGDMAWHRTQAELEWTGKLGPQIQIRSVAYHHWLDRSWTKFNRFSSGIDTHQLLKTDPGGQAAVYLSILRGEEDSLSQDQQLMIGTNHRIFHSFGLQTTAEWQVSTDLVESALELGVRLHGDHVQRIHTEEAHAMTDGALINAGEDILLNLDSIATANALAVYLHEDLSIGQFHLFPGIRYEGIQSERVDNGDDSADPVFKGILLPGMGMLVEALPVLDLFAGIHQGFSPVAPGQEADVQPELSWNYEAGTRLDLAHLNAEVVGFYNDYTNITGQCSFSGGCSGDELDRQYNGGAASVYGVEGSTEIRLSLSPQADLPIKASYAWTDASFTTSFSSSFPQYGQVTSGDNLPYLSEHQASLTVGIDHARGALNAAVNYRSGMLDEAGSLDSPDIPSLLTVDASVQASVTPDWLLYVTGTNLTGETGITSWRPFGARPIAPLQVMGGLKWTPSRR